MGHSLGALGALRMGDWGTTYGALHGLNPYIFRTDKVDFTIIKRKFWDNFVIKIGALLLNSRHSLEALYPLPISPRHI